MFHFNDLLQSYSLLCVYLISTVFNFVSTAHVVCGFPIVDIISVFSFRIFDEVAVL